MVKRKLTWTCVLRAVDGHIIQRHEDTYNTALEAAGKCARLNLEQQRYEYPMWKLVSEQELIPTKLKGE